MPAFQPGGAALEPAAELLARQPLEPALATLRDELAANLRRLRLTADDLQECLMVRSCAWLVSCPFPRFCPFLPCSFSIAFRRPPPFPVPNTPAPRVARLHACASPPPSPLPTAIHTRACIHPYMHACPSPSPLLPVGRGRAREGSTLRGRPAAPPHRAAPVQHRQRADGHHPKPGGRALPRGNQQPAADARAPPCGCGEERRLADSARGPARSAYFASGACACPATLR
jgi:hypothetical protein